MSLKNLSDFREKQIFDFFSQDSKDFLPYRKEQIFRMSRALSLIFPKSRHFLGAQWFLMVSRWVEKKKKFPIHRTICAALFLEEIISKKIPSEEWLSDLMHFEFIKHWMSNFSKEPTLKTFNESHHFSKNIEKCKLSLNPDLLILKYHYKVHQLGKKHLPLRSKKPVYLLLGNDATQRELLLELSESTAQLLLRLKHQSMTGLQLLLCYQSECSVPLLTRETEQARYTLGALYRLGVIHKEGETS